MGMADGDALRNRKTMDGESHARLSVEWVLFIFTETVGEERFKREHGFVRV